MIRNQGVAYTTYTLNGVEKKAPHGFSWTTLFFGPIPALLRGDLKNAAIMFALAIVTLSFAYLYFSFVYNRWLEDALNLAIVTLSFAYLHFPFVYNRWHEDALWRQGWKPKFVPADAWTGCRRTWARPSPITPNQPEPEVWIECACGRAQRAPERADAEPTCDACGASLAAGVSIAEVWIECACGRAQPLPDAADVEPTCAACGASLAMDAPGAGPDV